MTHLEREFKETDTSRHRSAPPPSPTPASAESSSSTVQLHPMNILAVKHKAGEKAAARKTMGADLNSRGAVGLVHTSDLLTRTQTHKRWRAPHARACTHADGAEPARRLITSPCLRRRKRCCAASAGCPRKPGSEGAPGRAEGARHGREEAGGGNSCDHNCKEEEEEDRGGERWRGGAKREERRGEMFWKRKNDDQERESERRGGVVGVENGGN